MATVQQQVPPTASTRRVDASRLSGVAFLVLFVAGFVMLVTGPNIYEGGTIEEYGAAFADGGREAAVTIAAFFVLPLAGACLLWAVAHVSRCMDRAVDGPSLGGRVATLGAAVMAAGMTVAGAATAAARHLASGVSDGFPADPATGYGLDMLGSQVINISLWGGSLVLVAIGIGARRTGLLPGWLLWTGIVVAPLLPSAFFFGMIPLLVFLLWVAVVAAMMRPGPVGSRP
jgi:hypothetical protein